MGDIKDDTIICNGIVYRVLAVAENPPAIAQASGRGELLLICRPKGVKEYIAERLPDSPIYGADRGRILCPAAPRPVRYLTETDEEREAHERDHERIDAEQTEARERELEAEERELQEYIDRTGDHDLRGPRGLS